MAHFNPLVATVFEYEIVIYYRPLSGEVLPVMGLTRQYCINYYSSITSSPVGECDIVTSTLYWASSVLVNPLEAAAYDIVL